MHNRARPNAQDSWGYLGTSRIPSRAYFAEKYATVESVHHATDDLLEEYAIRALHESDMIQLEGHLLICPDCRERLQSEIEFVTSMRDAAVKIRCEGNS